MSWFRGRRRTLDIVTEVGEFDAYNRNIDPLNTGVYNPQYDDGRFLEGVCENKVVEYSQDNEAGTRGNGKSMHQEENNNNLISENSSLHKHWMIGDPHKDDITNENCSDPKPCEFCSKTENHRKSSTGEGKEDSDGELSVNSEINELKFENESDCSFIEELDENDKCMEDMFKKSKRSNSRYSLDSQMPGLLKSTSLIKRERTSASSISESDFEMSTERPRKSISWAEDLETIHEFEKLKGRRLSLSTIFKKL